MNKRDLVEAVAAATGRPKTEAATAVDAIFEAISGALKNREKVQIAGFGAFEARYVKERTVYNPQDRSQSSIKPAHYAPKFKAGKALKDNVS
jgi:DNA-binding protein HU-beta